MPTNYVLILALEKKKTNFHRFLGYGFKVVTPDLADGGLTLREVMDGLSRRMAALYRRNREWFNPLHFLPTTRVNQTRFGRVNCNFIRIFMVITGRALGQRIKGLDRPADEFSFALSWPRYNWIQCWRRTKKFIAHQNKAVARMRNTNMNAIYI